MSAALVDRLVNAGLPAETIEGFRRVAPDAANLDASALNDEVKLVLRSGGEPLPNFAASPDQSSQRPPFVVCLAHHEPTDIFTLFAFSPDSIPCRLVRLDRDGTIITKGKEQHLEQHFMRDTQQFVPYLWDSNDAKVMVATVERCQGYFAVDATADNAFRTNESLADRADCLRLQPKSKGRESRMPSESNDMRDEASSDIDVHSDISEENEEEEEEDDDDEALAIRTLILDQLLYPSADGDDAATTSIFHNPNPNFLLPLCDKISAELKRWRDLCLNVPPRTVWPELPPSQEEERCDEPNGEAETEEDRACGKVGTEDRKLFDAIMSKRKDQVNKSNDLVKKGIERLRLLLHRAAESVEDEGLGHDTTAFELGSRCVALLVGLVQLQRWHYDDWYDYNEAFGEVCEGQDDEFKKKMDGIIAGLCVCHEEFKTEVGDSSREEIEEADESGDESEFDVDDAARSTIADWKKDDAGLLALISCSCSAVKEAIASGDQIELRNAAEQILSMKTKINIVEEKAHSKSIRNIARFVKLWNSPTSDDEEDGDMMWQESVTRPQWTERQEEAHMTFAHRVVEGEVSSPLLFLIDKVGFSDYLEHCIDTLSLRKRSRGYDSDYDDDDYLNQEDRFNARWKESISSILECALVSISNFVQTDDLLNASFLLVACCKILCNSKSVGNIRSKFRDCDGSYGSKKIIMNQLRQEIGRFDEYAVKISFKYFERDEIEEPLFLTGAHWLYAVLKCGALYFPCEKAYVDWGAGTRSRSESDHEPSWYRHAHPAAAVFTHRGWMHPDLNQALRKSATAAQIMQWARCEGPVVIKERFSVMKDRNDTIKAIALAKMLGGDDEALHYLVSSGLANDAIEQASLSGNVDGLKQVATDIVDSDPCASLLCAQAHLLRMIEKSEQDDESHVLQRDSVGLIADLFLKKWISSLVDLAANTGTSGISVNTATEGSVVPSLRHFSIMAATREFLSATMSTSQMQEILETKCSSSLDSRIVLAVAALALITQTTPDSGSEPSAGLRYALERAGLLIFTRDNATYSGLLVQFGSAFESPKTDILTDISCAVYECSKYASEREMIRRSYSGGFTVYDYAAGLFSSIFMAVQTGCHTFALREMEYIENNCDAVHGMHRSYETPHSCLVVSFNRLFCSNVRPDLQKQLMKTILSLRESEFLPEIVSKEQMYISLAYAREVGCEKAASLLAECVFYNQNEPSYSYSSSSDFYRTPVKVFEYLAAVDTKYGAALAEKHAMSSFASSRQRMRFNRSEREQMCSAYFCKLLSLSVSSKKNMSPGMVEQCVRVHRKMKPSFWYIEAGQVESWLSSQPTGTGLLALRFSEKEGLEYVYQIMNFVERELKNGETWSTPYFIFACGLRWLRAALMPAVLPSFNHACEQRSSALVIILETYALEIDDDLTPSIPGLCQEALALCRVMHFLLRPSIANFNEMANTTTDETKGILKLPLHLRPENLLNSILQPNWDTHNVDSGVPNLFLRVNLAVRNGMVKEASALCVVEGENGVSWDTLSDTSKYMGSIPKRARIFLQACLLTIRAAAVDPTAFAALSIEFINVFTYLILTMNWFQCCARCSPEISYYSNQLVPSKENIKALHAASSAWLDIIEKDNATISKSLKNCVRMMCCLARCCVAFEPISKSKKCSQCKIIAEEYNSVFEDGAEAAGGHSSRAERAAQRSKRKRELECDFESDFKELKFFMAQVHLKEASDWCDHVLPRIRAASSSQSPSAKARK